MGRRRRRRNTRLVPASRAAPALAPIPREKRISPRQRASREPSGAWVANGADGVVTSGATVVVGACAGVGSPFGLCHDEWPRPSRADARFIACAKRRTEPALLSASSTAMSLAEITIIAASAWLTVIFWPGLSASLVGGVLAASRLVTTTVFGGRLALISRAVSILVRLAGGLAVVACRVQSRAPVWASTRIAKPEATLGPATLTSATVALGLATASAGAGDEAVSTSATRASETSRRFVVRIRVPSGEWAGESRAVDGLSRVGWASSG